MINLSTEVLEARKIQLLLLQELLKVCNEHNLKIFAAYGTLLGAIRHKGFIPWDDDIDMDMLRPDYDKLVSIAPKAFQPPLFFQEAHTDKNYFKGHAQLRYDGTTAIRPDDMNAPFHQGIFIDIFVMDAVPACDPKKEKLIKETRNIFAYLRNKHKYNPHNPIKKIERFFRWRQFLHTPDIELYDRFENMFRQYKLEECAQVGPLSLTPYSTNSYHRKECYADTLWGPFEHLQIPIPVEYHEILSEEFGPNYMTPIQAPNSHGTLLIDAHMSYIDYIKKNKPTLSQKIKNKIRKKIRKLKALGK